MLALRAADPCRIVNRCQTEILRGIGRPAQQPEFLAFQEKLELRVEGLSQRLDAFQMVFSQLRK